MCSTSMSESITLEPVEEVPPNSRVCHYDELDEPAKETLPSLANGTNGAVENAVLESFRGCDLVKFTDYYQVSVR